LETALWRSRSTYETRRAAGLDYFIRTDPASRRVAAFAAALATLASSRAHADEESPFKMKAYGFLNAEVERVDADGGATPYRARGRVSERTARRAAIERRAVATCVSCLSARLCR